MTLAVPTVSYVLAGMVGGTPSAVPSRLPSLDDVSCALGKRFDLVVGGSSTAEQVVLDTADRRLRAAGMELLLEHVAHGERWVLSGPQGATHVVPGNDSLDTRAEHRRLADDLPTALSDRVAPVIGIRALLPIMELQRNTTPIAVHNRDQKTVVRLAVCQLFASRSGGDDGVDLGGRLEVQGVLGYQQQLAKVQDVLSSTLGLDEAARSIVDEAALALGLDPEGVPRKPTTRLTPAQPAGDAAVAVLRTEAGIVEANLPGALADLDTEFLHDVRVAVRRSRSVLRQLKRVFPAGARRTHADNLRWLQTVTGPTRDLDVQLLEWNKLVSHLSTQRRLDTAPGRDLLSARRAKEFRAMRRTLRGAAFERRWSAWRSFLASDSSNAATGEGLSKVEPAISDLAGQRIRAVYRRMVREGAAIDDSSPATALHELRKRGKELRYLLELFGDLWPDAVVTPLIAKLKQLQDVLGRHQDREVQAYSLRSLAPDLSGAPGGAEAVLALGSVIDRLEFEQGRARAAFAESFAAFASPKQAKKVGATFGRS